MFDVATLASAFQGSAECLRECHGYFSQSGEDILIDLLLGQEPQPGLFVDFGAYHPIRFSNTFTLYLRGWRGVNVDANAETVRQFHAVRPLDVTLHALLSDKVEELTYYQFAEGAYNTTNSEAAKMLIERNRPENALLSTSTFTTTTPNQILDAHVKDKKFDLLTIDVEGMDLRLLKSVDFSRYRPKVLVVELAIEQWISPAFTSFLSEIRYRPVSQCLHSAIFIRNEG